MIKEKRTVKKGLKEKVRSAPKQLVRRGLDDGTERLRGQLRDTAQRGQADDYGGDRIEDTAVGGVRRAERGAERGIEALLKKKKNGRDRMPQEEPRSTTEPPAPQESPADPPSQDPPRIKTRENITAREGGPVSYDGGGVKPTPAAGSERQRIKIRESVVHDAPVSEKPAQQTGSVRHQIKTRETVTGAHSDHTASTVPSSGENPSARLSIKTKDAYIQNQPAATSEPPPQAFTQGQRDFVQERGRTAAIKQAEIRRTGNGSVPQVEGSVDVTPPAPARRGYASARPVHRPVSPASSDIQPVQESGKAIMKTGRSVRKAPEHTARHAIKTAERSSRKTIKTAQRTAKTATRTAKTAGQTAKTAQKTAQATVKATQRAVQTARAAAKAAATTAKAAVKATVAAIKAAIAATQELIAAIAAGGWVALVVVLVILMVGLLIASPFGIFFSDGGSSGAVSPTAAIAQINREYADTLSGLQTGGIYDRVEIQGRPPAWADVFAVFSAKTTGAAGGGSVAVMDPDTVEKLRVVFWDMTKITTSAVDIEHPAEGDTPAWTETVLTITITPRTTDDMRVFYSFTEQQNTALDELLTAANREMWNNLLYGSSGDIVAVAMSQVGNVGGQPYWSWYGFNSRVEWCACFVSWCANECGYIDAGVIPKFAGCTGGSNWFKDRGQWQDNSYEPRPGDLIFFDWDNKGSSGPQDDVPDHVGIVERVENGIVYTVEGNTSDSCRQRSYSVGHYEIWGYGTFYP